MYYIFNHTGFYLLNKSDIFTGFIFTSILSIYTHKWQEKLSIDHKESWYAYCTIRYRYMVNLTMCQCVLNGVALDPFTSSNKNKWWARWKG